jgi:uncharacterized membrane protein YfcA
MWCAGSCGAACRGAGAWALTRFEPVYIKLALGLFLTANLPLLFLRPRAKPQDEPAPIKPARLMALGAAVGLVSGFTGAVGVLFNRFYIRLRMQRRKSSPRARPMNCCSTRSRSRFTPALAC